MRVVHRLLAALVMFVATMVATSCSPPPNSQVAARLNGDSIEILAYVCKGHRISIVQLYEMDSSGGWEAGPPIGSASHAEKEHLLRVPAFDAPDGWEILDDTLTRLEPGVRYALVFSAVPNRVSKIIFTVDELEEIGSQVWTGRTRNEPAVNQAEFVEIARRDC